MAQVIEQIARSAAPYVVRREIDPGRSAVKASAPAAEKIVTISSRRRLVPKRADPGSGRENDPATNVPVVAYNNEMLPVTHPKAIAEMIPRLDAHYGTRFPWQADRVRDELRYRGQGPVYLDWRGGGRYAILPKRRRQPNSLLISASAG